MDGIKTMAVSIGCTALICGLIEMIAPKDRFKVTVETVIGLFALISVATMFKGCSFEMGDLTEKAANIESQAEEDFSETLIASYSKAVIKCFEDKLTLKGINYDKIEVEADVKENTITVEKVIVYANDNYDLIKEIGQEIGIATEIERTEPTDE